MRKSFLKFVLTPMLILGFAGFSHAFTAVNTGKITPNTQKSLTGFVPQVLGNTSGNVETTQATVITGLTVISGSSVDLVGLYDWGAGANGGVSVGPAPNSSCVFEASSAANTSTFYDFSNAPIRTLNGLEAAQSQSTGGFIVYTVQQN